MRSSLEPVRGMVVQDDRTAEQKKTHTWLVIGTDRFMSGWGKASGGVSIAAWACEPRNREAVFNWVSRRSDMKRVRDVCGAYRPKGNGHCHIYVVENDHPALG